MTDVPMLATSINDRWSLLLPEHRHGRLQWPTWEKERLAAMYEVIAAPSTRPAPLGRDGWAGPHLVFDIGAEEGDFPALWASWGADVVMVEPNARVWPNVRAIFEANRLVDRVRGWFVGFAGTTPHGGSTAQQVEAVDLDGWPRCAYGEVIGDHGFLALPERPDVPVTTIDHLAAAHGDPTVVTVDVEGAELVVLRGAHRVLSEARPAVFLSVHLDEFWVEMHYEGDTPDTIQTFMRGYGYEGRWLATDHEQHWEWRHPEGR